MKLSQYKGKQQVYIIYFGNAFKADAAGALRILFLQFGLPHFHNEILREILLRQFSMWCLPLQPNSHGDILFSQFINLYPRGEYQPFCFGGSVRLLRQFGMWCLLLQPEDHGRILFM